MVHPAFGFPLRNAAIILSIIDIIGSIFGTISSIITLLCVAFNKTGESPILKDGSAGTFTVTHRSQGITKLLDESSSAVYSVLGFVTLTCIVELILSMILLKGSKNRDAAYCKIWWRTKLAIFLASSAVITFAFVVSEDRLDFAVGGVFGILYQIYGLWVVRVFIGELDFSLDCEQKEELSTISVKNSGKYGDLYNKGIEYIRLEPSATASSTPDPGPMTKNERFRRNRENIEKTFANKLRMTTVEVENNNSKRGQQTEPIYTEAAAVTKK